MRTAATTVSTRPISNIGSADAGKDRQVPAEQHAGQADDLQDGLVLGELAHLDLAALADLGHPFAQRRDGDLAADDDDGAQHEDDAAPVPARSVAWPPSRPSRPGTMIVRHLLAHQQHQRHRHDELVGHRIEERAEARGLAHAAREVAVERVGDAGEREQQARRRIRPAGTVDRTSTMTSGIAKIRSQVSVFGRFQIIASKLLQAPGCR